MFRVKELWRIALNQINNLSRLSRVQDSSKLLTSSATQIDAAAGCLRYAQLRRTALRVAVEFVVQRLEADA